MQYSLHGALLLSLDTARLNLSITQHPNRKTQRTRGHTHRRILRTGQWFRRTSDKGRPGGDPGTRCRSPSTRSSSCVFCDRTHFLKFSTAAEPPNLASMSIPCSIYLHKRVPAEAHIHMPRG